MTVFSQQFSLNASSVPVSGVLPAANTRAGADIRAAGYTTPVLIDEFTSNTFGQNWFSYNVSPYTTGVNVTNTEVYITTAAPGILTITTDHSGYGLGLQTINSETPVVSSNPSVVQGGGFVTSGARAFRYGFFECSMNFDPTINGTGNGSNPGFWSGCIPSQSQTFPHDELDFVEIQPQGNGTCKPGMTIHEAVDANGPGAGNGQTQVDITQITGSTYTTTGAMSYSNFNTYACLWTPTKITFYINNQLAPMPNGTNPVAVGPGTPFTAAAIDSNAVGFGCGVNWPMTLDFVHIWQ